MLFFTLKANYFTLCIIVIYSLLLFDLRSNKLKIQNKRPFFSIFFNIYSIFDRMEVFLVLDI